MAEIVQSLFGVTPQMYQQQQSDAADARAMQYARLSPFEQANFAIGRGASQLVGALGGQDPQLQMISARNQIAQQIDYNSPESIAAAVRRLSEIGDSQGAMMLADVGRKAQSEQALQFQRGAAGQASLAAATRERTVAEPTTPQITNARALAARKGPAGSPEYEAEFNAQMDRLTADKEAKGPSFGTDREAVAAEVYDKPFALLSPTEKAVVNKRVDTAGTQRAKASAATLVLPGQKELVDIPKFRSTVQGTIDPQLKAINAADQALTAIEDSIATNNFVSFNAARVQLAKSLGDSQLSRRDVEQAGGDPSVLGGLLDTTSKLFTSTPSVDTQKKIQKTLEAIRTVAANKASKEVEQQRKIALRTPGYNADAVTEALTFSELAPRAPARSGGGGDLAAQAAVELARRQQKQGR